VCNLKQRCQYLVYRAREEELQRIRVHFPRGHEEDGEVEIDAFDGVGREEVPGITRMRKSFAMTFSRTANPLQRMEERGGARRN
jgi:hypothetical protein